MYKLTAQLDSGLRFITNSSQINDLQRIAVSQGAVYYTITLFNELIIESVADV